MDRKVLGRMIKILERLKTIDTDEVLAKCNKISPSRRVEGVILDTRPFSITDYPHLKVISRVGVGLDNVDLGVAHQLGVKVMITPCVELINSVAEHTLHLILSVLRCTDKGKMLKNKSVLIIGYGRIGQAVEKLLKPITTNTDYYDIAPIHDMNTEDLHYLLEDADIVCIHVSGNDCVIGKEELKVMRNDAFLVNVARAGCVDIEAVQNALWNCKLGGFASDVNPPSQAMQYQISLKRCVFTLHVASNTVEARTAMEQMAVRNLITELEELHNEKQESKEIEKISL